MNSELTHELTIKTKRPLGLEINFETVVNTNLQITDLFGIHGDGEYNTLLYLGIRWWLVIGQWRSCDLEIIQTISRGKFQKTIARYKWSCTAVVIFV